MDTRKSLVASMLVALSLFAAIGKADAPSWIQGTTSPSVWVIDPVQPQDTDSIHFSGPAPVCLNHCLAEADLGGQPTIHTDTATRTIELKFTLPASTNCTSVVLPVCGLQGTLGPLSAGQWLFFCTKADVTFSITFQVTSQKKGHVLYVDAAATGTHNGSNWSHAFKYLQDALAVAVRGSEVHVAAGTYRPDRGGAFTEGDPNATFHLRSGVILKGGYAGGRHTDPNARSTTLYETILTGDLDGNDKVARPADMTDPVRRADNSYHVVSTNDADATTVLDGFTITGGGNFGSRPSGEQTNGGGICNVAGRPIIQNCRIVNNAAPASGGGLFSGSGGSPTLLDCTFIGNWANAWGGAMYSESSSHMTVDRCLISGNAAADGGGAISTISPGKLSISNSVISGNLVTDSTWGQGGALHSTQGQVRLDHCTIVDNRAAMGAALACGDITSYGSARVTLDDSIVWNGTNWLLDRDETPVEVSYSDVQGGYAGKGNLALDPRFAKAGSWNLNGTSDTWSDDVWTNGDYHLTGSSPCIDAGDPQETPPATDLDLAGRPRRSGVAVDMGAYESKDDVPVAKAISPATGFSPDGKTGLVTLDGTASYDPDGSPLTYRWYRKNTLVSTAAKFTTELPLGDYLFTLIVNDGTMDSEPLQVTARILTYTLTTLDFIPNPMSRSEGNDPVTAVLTLPSGKEPADFDQSQPLVFLPGYLDAETQAAQVWLNGNRLVIATFDKAQVLKAIPANGTTTVQVAGRLKNGTYFGATQNLTITR